MTPDFLYRSHKYTVEKKKASSKNGASLTVCSMWENTNRSLSIILHKTQVQVHQRIQDKSRYSEPDRREGEH